MLAVNWELYLEKQDLESGKIGIGGQFHGTKQDSIFGVVGGHKAVLIRRRFGHRRWIWVGVAGMQTEVGEGVAADGGGGIGYKWRERWQVGICTC